MASPTPAEVNRLIVAKERAEAESEYAETIRCTAAVVSGDRYKITFSEYTDHEGGY